MFHLNEDGIAQAIEVANRDIDLANRLLDNANGLARFLSLDTPTESEQSWAQCYAQNMNTIAGVDDFVTLEALTVDKVKEYGRQAYRAIADFILKIIAVVRGWWNKLFNNHEKQAEELRDAITEFDMAVKRSDEIIKELDLETGRKPTTEELAAIADRDGEVMMNFQGHIVNSEYVYANMQDMIAPGRRNDTRFYAITDAKNSTANITVRMRDAHRDLWKFNVASINPEFKTYGERLFGVNSVSDIDWLDTDRVKLCHEYIVRTINTFKLRKGMGTNYTAKAIVDDWYPIFNLVKNGDCEYFTFKISPNEKGTKTVKAKSARVNHASISFAEVKELMAVLGDINGAMTALQSQIERELKVLEKIVQSNGQNIAEAVERLSQHYERTDPALLKALENEVRNYPKSFNGITDIATNLGKAFQTLSQGIGYYVDSMISIKTTDTGQPDTAA